MAKIITFNGKNIEDLTKKELIESIKLGVEQGYFRVIEKTESTLKVEGKDKEFYYFRESALQSWAADAVTFGLLFSGFILNALVLGGKWYIHMFFIIMFFIVSSARGNKRAHRFTDLKEFKDFVAKIDDKERR